jgi:rhamnosyltransferase
LIAVIIPTYNASKYLSKLFKILRQQTVNINEIIIIDSSSTDNTVDIAKTYGAEIVIISKDEFDHGGTRTKAGKISKGDILIYLTQDALPYDEHTIENIVKPFQNDEKIGAAFGRQLPYPDATPFAKHLRLFNYPDKSYLRSIEDKEKYGLKACFCSNSFAAYRRAALEEIEWFKDNLIFGEDACAGAKLLLAGYKIAYMAEAKVYHSHNYTIVQELKRYFDLGVFHKSEHWLLEEFGRAEGEGKKYLKSELSFLFGKHKLYLLPEFIIRNGMKFLGYKLGKNFDKLPTSLTRYLSMNKNYWNTLTDLFKD